MLADGEVIEYKDSATDVAFIAVVRKVSENPSSCCIKFCTCTLWLGTEAPGGLPSRKNASPSLGLQNARTGWLLVLP